MRRFTLSRLMAAIAVLGFDAGLVRAFLYENMLIGAILAVFALQFGVWCHLRTRGRFWLGFLAGGAATLLVFFACEPFPDSMPSRLLRWYIDLAFNLAALYFPTVLDDLIMEHQDWFLVIAYFLPELAASVLGGLVALGFRGHQLRPVAIEAS